MAYAKTVANNPILMKWFCKKNKNSDDNFSTFYMAKQIVVDGKKRWSRLCPFLEDCKDKKDCKFVHLKTKQ